MEKKSTGAKSKEKKKYKSSFLMNQEAAVWFLGNGKRKENQKQLFGHREEKDVKMNEVARGEEKKATTLQHCIPKRKEKGQKLNKKIIMRNAKQKTILKDSKISASFHMRAHFLSLDMVAVFPCQHLLFLLYFVFPCLFSLFHFISIENYHVWHVKKKNLPCLNSFLKFESI